MPGVVQILRRRDLIVVPVFISNLGCPGACVYCDQRVFAEALAPEQLERAVRDFLNHCADWPKRRRILAFYGGSFTALEPALLEAYLNQARRLIEMGLIDGLKASTRPDAIDLPRLERLKAAGFVALELGAQSFDDRVLSLSGRAHTAACTCAAAGQIKAAGLELGLQLMPGLPGEDLRSFTAGIETAVRLAPASFRIYPTVVLKGTALERQYAAGQYRPLELAEAVDRSLYGSTRLSAAGARCLRLGLPPLEAAQLVAGPYHPAFGELVRSRAFGLLAAQLLGAGATCLAVNPADLSALIGYERRNLQQLNFSYVCEPELPRGALKRAGEKACLYFSNIIHELV